MAKRGGFPGGMPGNMTNLMKQAQRMQRQMEEKTKELEEKEYTAAAGGGAVTVTVSGKKEVVSVKLSPEAVDPDDVDPTADEVQIAREDQKDQDVVNILLVGSDARDPDAELGRSDTMMLVSFNKAEGKATVISFLRDTLIDIDGYGMSKLGHTFAYGGVGLTINTLNKQFDLDIQDYIIINFENLVEIIDELGGIQVNLTEEEAEYYRQTGMPDIQSGWVTLTGSQALAHARNRSLDNDFGRTSRQRSVLYGIYNKVMENKNPADILPLIKFCMTQVSTNMGVTELYSLATDVMGVEHLKTQQAAVPRDGTYEFDTYDSMSVLTIDLEANKEYIKELLY